MLATNGLLAERACAAHQIIGLARDVLREKKMAVSARERKQGKDDVNKEAARRAHEHGCNLRPFHLGSFAVESGRRARPLWAQGAQKISRKKRTDSMPGAYSQSTES
jgi:hypothetical protein